MFNNVWFYVLLYAALGALAISADTKACKRMQNKVKAISWEASLEFENKAFIHCSSTGIACCLLVIGCVLWPVFTVVAFVNRIKAYNKIMKEELDKKRMDKTI